MLHGKRKYSFIFGPLTENVLKCPNVFIEMSYGQIRKLGNKIGESQLKGLFPRK